MAHFGYSDFSFFLFYSGYLGPGGLHLSSSFPGECIGGAAGYIDRLILTTDHIYNHPSAKSIYLSGPFDPEGILGNILSINNSSMFYRLIRHNTFLSYCIIDFRFILDFIRILIRKFPIKLTAGYIHAQARC